MAKVKIQGHASGTGILTVTAPNTSTDRTITLPDATGTLLTEVADNAVTLAKMAGGTDGNIISYDASGDPVAIATGDDGQVLTSAGAGAQPAFEDAPTGGGLQSQQVFAGSGTTSSSSTWTRPSGITLIKVTVVGGGGSGGGGGDGASGHDSGSGGGGGGTSIEIIDVTSLASETVTIGGGGAGVGDSSDGNAGGTSSFGSYCSATGGAGGLKGSNSGNIYGGIGGLGSGGDLNFNGGSGDSGIKNASTPPPKGAIGGGSFYGGIAYGLAGASARTGRTYGGGSGGGVSAVYGTSGNAGVGVVVIEEYIK
jgi:hypothetical protein